MKEMWPRERLRALSQRPAVNADFRLWFAAIALGRSLLGVTLVADRLQVAFIVVVHVHTVESDHLICGGAGFVDDVVDSIGSSGARAAETGLTEMHVALKYLLTQTAPGRTIAALRGTASAVLPFPLS